MQVEQQITDELDKRRRLQIEGRKDEGNFDQLHHISNEQAINGTAQKTKSDDDPKSSLLQLPEIPTDLYGGVCRRRATYGDEKPLHNTNSSHAGTPESSLDRKSQLEVHFKKRRMLS